MRCFHPLRAKRHAGRVQILGAVENLKGRVHSENGADLFSLRCGQCIGCRLNRAREWSIRGLHESQLYDVNSFVTLTYDDMKLWRTDLVYKDFQAFMRRLRYARGNKNDVRFYMAGEYGEDFGRPHFHCILFNCGFSDRYPFGKTPAGCQIYRSPMLERLWPHGFSSVGDVTLESIGYVARYCVKKVTGAGAAKHYEAVDGFTGEIIQRRPEFNKMSLRPAIGKRWFEQFRADIYGVEVQEGRDYVVVDGAKLKPPRYYDKLLKSVDGFAKDAIDYFRGVKMESLLDDSSPERLNVQEIVAKARLSFKKRIVK